MNDATAAAEATLCRIFAEVLNVALVRPHEAFFQIGGDSVLALRVVTRAREAGLTLSIRQLFEQQSASTLAAVIGDLPAVTSASSAAVPGESPLLVLADDEIDQFEDVDGGQQVSGDEVGWEMFR